MKLQKCEICGNIVEVIVDKGVPLMCCGTKLVDLVPNTTEAATEKHLPVASIEGDQLLVSVGEVNHPMTPEHLITAITVVLGDTVQTVTLKDTDEPKATFALNGYKGKVEVYEYCNLHGLWKTELEA